MDEKKSLLDAPSQKDLFKDCIESLNNAITSEEKYKKILQLGKQLPKLPSELKSKENIVSGCQSVTYLHTYSRDNLLYFEAESNALISAGIARLLTLYFSEKTPEEVVQNNTTFLEKLNLKTLLSPSRANGLESMIIKIKQSAIKYLI